MHDAMAFSTLIADSPQPLRLVLLSGEQVLPNLESVLMCLVSGRLASVHIVCTHNARASMEPALRLAGLLGQLQMSNWGARARPAVRVSTPGLDGSPQAVRQWVGEQMRLYPDSQWLFNLTGGLKPMSFGLLDLLHGIDVQGIYLERHDGWMRVLHDGAGTHTVPLQPAAGQRHLVDRIAVAQLAHMQLASSDASDGRLQVSSDPLPELGDLGALTSRLIDCGWDFAGVLRSVGARLGNGGHGPAFEAYLGNVLKQAGVHNLAWSLKLTHAKQHVLECDLVACHHGQVVVMDVKLTDESGGTPTHEQIRSAHAAMRNLGGLAASAVLVRPNWDPDPALQAMASAHRMTLLDGERCGRVFDELARVLHLADQGLQAIRPIADAVAQWHYRHGTVFLAAGHPKRRHAVERDEKSKALMLLPAFERAARADGRNWVALHLGGSPLLAIMKPSCAISYPPATLRKLRALLQGFRPLLAQRDLLLLQPLRQQEFSALLTRLEREFAGELPLQELLPPKP